MQKRSLEKSNPIFLYIIGAVASSSVLTTAITRWFDRRKLGAETTDLLSQAWERSLRNLTDQLDRMEDRVFELEKKLDRAYRTIREQKDEIESLKAKLLRRRQGEEDV